MPQWQPMPVLVHQCNNDHQCHGPLYLKEMKAILAQVVSSCVNDNTQKLWCTPTYTDQIFSRPIFASFTDKKSQKQTNIITSFAHFLQWLHLNNWQYLAWLYKRGKRGVSCILLLLISLLVSETWDYICLVTLTEYFCETARK